MTPKKLPTPYDPPESYPVANMEDPDEIAAFLDRTALTLKLAANELRTRKAAQDPSERLKQTLPMIRKALDQLLLARRVAAEWALEYTRLTMRDTAGMLQINHATTYRMRHAPVTYQDVADVENSLVPD